MNRGGKQVGRQAGCCTTVHAWCVRTGNKIKSTSWLRRINLNVLAPKIRPRARNYGLESWRNKQWIAIRLMVENSHLRTYSQETPSFKESKCLKLNAFLFWSLLGGKNASQSSTQMIWQGLASSVTIFFEEILFNRLFCSSRTSTVQAMRRAYEKKCESYERSANVDYHNSSSFFMLCHYSDLADLPYKIQKVAKFSFFNPADPRGIT